MKEPCPVFGGPYDGATVHWDGRSTHTCAVMPEAMVDPEKSIVEKGGERRFIYERITIMVARGRPLMHAWVPAGHFIDAVEDWNRQCRGEEE